MNIKCEYSGEILTSLRKMRTTRGPGFTELQFPVRVTVTDPAWDGGMRLPSMEDPFMKAVQPAEWKAFGADLIFVNTTYWYRNAEDQPTFTVGIRVRYEDVGHARRAQNGMAQILLNKKAGVETAFAERVAQQVLDAHIAAQAAEKTAQELSWMASGIVSEARRRGREEMNYDEQAKRLRTALANHTENHAIDLASEVARDHGVDEAALKVAVEELLAKPVWHMGSI